jgi:hypothetical protein
MSWCSVASERWLPLIAGAYAVESRPALPVELSITRRRPLP